MAEYLHAGARRRGSAFRGTRDGTEWSGSIQPAPLDSGDGKGGWGDIILGEKGKVRAPAAGLSGDDEEEMGVNEETARKDLTERRLSHPYQKSRIGETSIIFG